MLNEKYLKGALERFPQKCLLINVLSKRVEQLNNGARPQIDDDSMSNLDIALKEIADGKVFIKSLEEDYDGKVKKKERLLKQRAKKIKKIT